MFMNNDSDKNTVLHCLSPNNMTLEGAIEHCTEVIARCNAENNTECAEQHAQLLSWLKELQQRQLKDQQADEFYWQVN